TLFILLLRKTPRMLSAISASGVLLFAVKYVHEKNVDKEDLDRSFCSTHLCHCFASARWK
ncbi:MAG: hypothetical protein ACLTWW_12240, partial [Negativibacillus sp.]